MTDKDKIRAEIERRISRNKRNKVFEDVPEKRHQLIIEGQLLGELKHFIDSLQEESQVKESAESQHKEKTCKENGKFLTQRSVSNDFEMALAEMIDNAQKCVVEPLVVAEQWKDYLIELAKNEKPVIELIDFEQELYKAFGQIKDFTLGIAIAKRFYDMGRKHNEPVNEDLELAWEDIPKILHICEQLKTKWWFRDDEQTKQIGRQPFWEEVLKLFKEMKGNTNGE